MDEEAVVALLRETLAPLVDGEELDDDMLDYMGGSLTDNTLDPEDVVESVSGFLLDLGAAADEDGAAALCADIMGKVRLARIAAGGGEPEPAGDVGAPALLKERVIVKTSAQAADAKIAQLLTTTLDASKDGGNVNSEIKIFNIDEGTTEDLTEKQLRDLIKSRKRDTKRFAKDTRLEKASALRRNALIEALKSRPVVLHRDQSCSVIPDINLNSVQMDLHGKVLLEDCTCAIVAGRRYGLVGKNGAGKTTFLRHLAAKKFEGVASMEELQIVHIEQEVEGDERSVLATVLACDFERDALLEEEADIRQLLAELEDPTNKNGFVLGGQAVRDEGEALDQRLGDIYARLAEIEADSAEARASKILSGLQFSKDEQQRPTSSFSGGWRMRVSLAQALFINPDVLLLDEPTNHLDLHAVIWLENYLLTWDKTLIVVSHARGFLNSVCTDTLHLHDLKIVRYKNCNYDDFENVRATQLATQQKQHESTEAKRKHIQSFIDKNRASAAGAKMAQSRIKALERMGKVDAVVRDPTIKFSFPRPETLMGPAIQLIDVSFGYASAKAKAQLEIAEAALSKLHTADTVTTGTDTAGQSDSTAGTQLTLAEAQAAVEQAKTQVEAAKSEVPLFSNVNLSLDCDSKVCLVGPNGVGKSTLIKVICGDVEPTTGLVNLNSKLRIGRFTQHHVDQLDMSKTPLEMLQVIAGSSVPVQALRTHLGAMGLPGRLALQPIYTMSGGQKSRVSLAMISWPKPHILLLDEPTNHLDLDTVSALIECLLEFRGGILVVSHDEAMITSVCDSLWVASDGTVAVSKGDFEDYKKKIGR